MSNAASTRAPAVGVQELIATACGLLDASCAAFALPHFTACVGAGDAVIPPNVKSAANFFQKTGKIINGEAPIRAKDPNQTEIIGNFEYDYKNSEIDVSDLSWRKKLFRKAHAQMDRDPEVWRKVKHLILEEIEEAEAHED